MRLLLVTLVVLTTACAGAGGRTTAPVSESAAEMPEAPPTVTVDESDLTVAVEAARNGDLHLAAQVADSLFDEWTRLGWLESEPVRLLSELLDSVGEELLAARLLVLTRYELEGGERDRLRDLAEQLSVEELELLRADARAEGKAATVVGAELAQAFALAGWQERSEEIAAMVLAADPDGTDRRKAEDVEAGRLERMEAPIRVGVVLPGSGRFEAVGERILEGALLAVELRGQTLREARKVELVVLDDSSRVDTGVRHVKSLVESGVVAILGPVRTEALLGAASSRDDDDLLLLSPTASGGQGTDLNVYSAWDRERREADAAAAVAAWLVDEMMLRTFGMLHPISDGQAAVAAARAVIESAGGQVLSVQTFDPDSTTFEASITALAAAEPDAVIVLTDSPRTVLQVAPQLVYYGLRRWVTAGGPEWSDPIVVRRLGASYADHRVVGTFVDRVSPGTEWERFKNRYEAKYRKALSDNMFAALGYDAMTLILKGLPEAGPERRGAVGRSLRRLDPYRGATGDFRVDDSTGALKRDVFVRVLLGGELVEPDAAAMMEWAREQRELEEFLRALEEEKEAEEGRGGRR